MARKKEAGTNEIAEKQSNFKDLFTVCPFTTLSKFEQENFNSTTGVGYARYVISVINKIRKIESDLETETRTFERNCLSYDLHKLYAYLESQDPQTLRNAVDSWESVEREYWVNTLGKQAAIELITEGKTSTETMSKMVRLPEDMYIKVTQICVRLANTIKQTTVRAEEEIGVVQPKPQEDRPTVEAPGPKKINLKKI